MEYLHFKSDDLKKSLEAVFAEVPVCVCLITHNFVEGARRGDMSLLAEIEKMRTLRLNCILFFFDDLKRKDMTLANQIFERHTKLWKFVGVPSRLDLWKKWLDENKWRLKELAGCVKGGGGDPVQQYLS